MIYYYTPRYGARAARTMPDTRRHKRAARARSHAVRRKISIVFRSISQPRRAARRARVRMARAQRRTIARRQCHDDMILYICVMI